MRADKIKEAQAQIRRLRGLLNSGCLRDNEVAAKQNLLDLWTKELGKLLKEK